MAGNNTTDLEGAFRKAVSDFNKDDFKKQPQNYTDRLKHDLAPNVKMKRIDDPSYYDEAKGEVTTYFLAGNGSKFHATFTPDEPPEVQIVDSTGFVSGTGTFVDDTGRRRIVYSFAFAFTAVDGGSWKALFLWGKDKRDIKDI